MNDHILLNTSVVDYALSHDLKACPQEHFFSIEMMYMFAIMRQSFSETGYCLQLMWQELRVKCFEHKS